MVSNKFQVLSFDPGGTTGVAWAAFKDEAFVDKAQWQIDKEDHHTEIYDTIENFKNGRRDFGPLYVVSESFEYRNDSRPGLVLISREYIGVMQYWCQTHNQPLHQQTAGEGKNFANQKKLELIGMYVDSYDYRHCNEAASHLAYFVMNTLKVKKPFTDEWKKLLNV